jgi:hypothetical protein
MELRAYYLVFSQNSAGLRKMGLVSAGCGGKPLSNQTDPARPSSTLTGQAGRVNQTAGLISARSRHHPCFTNESKLRTLHPTFKFQLTA